MGDIGHGEIANTLLPQFPCEGKHHRTDHQTDKPEHLETAKATHEDPDETQASSVTRDDRPDDLVATEQDEAAQPERDKRWRAGDRHREL